MWRRLTGGEPSLLELVVLSLSPGLLTPGLTSLMGRKEYPPKPQTQGPAEVLPWPPLHVSAGGGSRGDLLCCLSFPVVSSDSDSDSDLSSSSLDDGLPPTGVRDSRGDKAWGESGKCGKYAACSPSPRCRVV